MKHSEEQTQSSGKLLQSSIDLNDISNPEEFKRFVDGVIREVANIAWWRGFWASSLLWSLLLILVWLTGCSVPHDFGYDSPPSLDPICIRWEAEDGYLYQRDATFATHKAQDMLSTWPHSHPGQCEAGTAGQHYKVTVCLVASSPCAHDRTTEVWPDEADKYIARYPGSYKGPCEGECHTHKDECLSSQHRGPKDWRQWKAWMREMNCSTPGRVCR